jgi:hypothetical protein
MTAPTTHPRHPRRLVTIAVVTLLCVSPALAQQPQSTTRTLTGTVTDTTREPLRNAVVELQNPANNSVETYLTDAAGHYTFKRLDSQTDYRVWVVFRSHHTPTRSISKFDSHMAKVINFKISSH